MELHLWQATISSVCLGKESCSVCCVDSLYNSQKTTDISGSESRARQTASSTVNYIKTRPPCAPLSAKLHEEMGFNQDSVSHTKACWLSKGKVLGRFFELRSKLKAYAMDCTKSEVTDLLYNQRKMCLLDYVTDIAGKLNE
ncbi:hypothetical protein KIL84_009093 [Mauremys mutica]|uniref:Uncharacterized protein n=1 Tax=Mauremys mutica TaxID=74926 RepID=A0A9D3XID7_9SAUR|nr:hypothetical protein KIL84_009093 [Mauremys mutica]